MLYLAKKGDVLSWKRGVFFIERFGTDLRGRYHSNNPFLYVVSGDLCRKLDITQSSIPSPLSSAFYSGSTTSSIIRRNQPPWSCPREGKGAKKIHVEVAIKQKICELENRNGNMEGGTRKGAKVIRMSGADEAESGIKNNSVPIFMLEVMICGSTI